jgi:nitrate reductase NapE component
MIATRTALYRIIWPRGLPRACVAIHAEVKVITGKATGKLCCDSLFVMNERRNDGCGLLALMVAASILLPLIMFSIYLSTWTGCSKSANGSPPEKGFTSETFGFTTFVVWPFVFVAIVSLVGGLILFIRRTK